MDLLSAIGSAIQTLQGIDCDKDLQSINIVTMMVMHIPSSSLSLTGVKDWISHCPKFSQGIMQQIVFIILSQM